MFSSFLIHGQSVTVDVDFKLTELEKPDRRLADVPVRLVLGEGPDWQGPNAGQRFVTDAKGEAHFTAPGVVDRRMRMAPYAMTGVSVPKRTDHMQIAVELEQLVPTASGDFHHYQWLHTLDIDCYTASDCATSDIAAVYTRDVQGRFTRKGRYDDRGLSMPELGGMMLGAPGYKAADFFLSTADPERKRWTLRLMLQRKPAPVWR
jgi:hypothetical protein